MIRRWVRLKQASKAAAADVNPGGGVATAVPEQTDAVDDAPFDLASLPSIEEIAADTDIIAFLRAGVPAELTRAALRRAWASDPAIRDFIGIAENQWDFNDPNGIPGFGPLTPMENSADALAQISGRFQETIAKVTPPAFPASAPAPLDSAEVQISDAVEQDSPNEMPAPNSEHELAEDHHVPETRRRHGGALPR
jgi:hypothetical protein